MPGVLLAPTPSPASSWARMGGEPWGSAPSTQRRWIHILSPRCLCDATGLGWNLAKGLSLKTLKEKQHPEGTDVTELRLADTE